MEKEEKHKNKKEEINKKEEFLKEELQKEKEKNMRIQAEMINFKKRK